MAKAKTSEQEVLNVQRRAITGTRPMRRLRMDGHIPGVVYGKNMKPVAITIPHKPFIQLLHSRVGEHALVRLRVEGGTPWEKPALVHDVQHNPVTGDIIHVDFHAIALTEEVHVKIPVTLRGEPVGVKEEGGILEHFLRELEVECLPTEIPKGIIFDVSAFKIGDTVHVRELSVPDKVKVLTDAEAAVASVHAPKEEKIEEPAEAVTEPEVISERKEEAEEGAEGGRAGEVESAAKEQKEGRKEPADKKEKGKEK